MIFSRFGEVDIKKMELIPNYDLDADGSFMPFNCIVPKKGVLYVYRDGFVLIDAPSKKSVHMSGTCTKEEIHFLARIYVEGK